MSARFAGVLQPLLHQCPIQMSRTSRKGTSKTNQPKDGHKQRAASQARLLVQSYRATYTSSRSHVLHLLRDIHVYFFC